MKFVFILIFSLAIIEYVTAVCNVCNDNGVACINDKDFYLCEKGQVNNATKFSCSGEKICTRLGAVCLEKTAATAVPACGDTSNCGKCDGTETDGIYTCTSRTTFTMCFDSALTDIRDTCPENQICDISLGKTGQNPCVPDCREAEIEFCDLYEAIDMPVVATTQATDTTSATGIPDTTTTQLNNEVTQTRTTVTTTTVENPTTQQQATTAPIDSTTETISTTPLPPTTITTATQPITTALPTTQSPGEALCSQQTAVGRYSYPNDTTCKSYVICFSKGGVMNGTLLNCPTDKFFNDGTKLCGNIKPQGCT